MYVLLPLKITFCLVLPTSRAILHVFFQISDTYGAIPLHYACRFLGNDSMIGLFLNFPQLFNYEMHDKKKSIDIMIEYNDPKIIKHFFDRTNMITLEDIAALSPENKVVSLLKQQYEQAMNHDHSRLYFACRQLHSSKTVSHLINPHSIMYLDKQTGLSPLMVAVQHRQLECIKELLNNKYFIQEAFNLVSNISLGTVLHICAKVHHKEITKILFNSRFMSNTLAITADVLGNTSLHICAQVGNVYMTQLLLDYITGHNLSTQSIVTSSLIKKNKDKLTPLYVAIQAGHLDVVNNILKYADASVINMCDDQQRTGLHIAAAKGEKKINTRTVCVQYRLEYDIFHQNPFFFFCI